VVGPPRERRLASDGGEYTLRSRVLGLDPLEQRVALGIHAERWRDGALETVEERTLTINLYFRNELLLMLERAGFADVRVEGDHNDLPATSDDEFLDYVARRGSYSGTRTTLASPSRSSARATDTGSR
jgi:hypothetical protein